MSTVVHALDALLAEPAVANRQIAGVWLFGSHARGTANADSDVDFAILCRPALELDRFRLIDAVGRAIGGEIDIIDLATAPPALAWEIVTTGRLVVERDEAEIERFVRAARYAAEDDEQRSRMILLAQTGSVGGVER